MAVVAQCRPLSCLGLVLLEDGKEEDGKEEDEKKEDGKGEDEKEEDGKVSGGRTDQRTDQEGKSFLRSPPSAP